MHVHEEIGGKNVVHGELQRCAQHVRANDDRCAHDAILCINMYIYTRCYRVGATRVKSRGSRTTEAANCCWRWRQLWYSLSLTLSWRSRLLSARAKAQSRPLFSTLLNALLAALLSCLPSFNASLPQFLSLDFLRPLPHPSLSLSSFICVSPVYLLYLSLSLSFRVWVSLCLDVISSKSHRAFYFLFLLRGALALKSPSMWWDSKWISLILDLRGSFIYVLYRRVGFFSEELFLWI